MVRRTWHTCASIQRHELELKIEDCAIVSLGNTRWWMPIQQVDLMSAKIGVTLHTS
jgi:hypothetical protein